MGRRQVKHIVLTALAFAALVSASCVGNSTIPNRPALSAIEVRSLSSEFRSIARNQVEAWNTHDLNIIRQVYTEDIVHHDGAPRFEGIDVVMAMAHMMMSSYPDWEGRLGATFIGRESGLGIWEAWNILGFSKDDPGIEFDLIESRGGRISYWTLFYGPQTLVSLGAGDLIDEELLANYATAWSSGDPETVASLYAQDAAREDSLFSDYRQGRDDIRKFATDFFAWYPGVTLEVLQPFAERSPGKVRGATFAFHVLDLNGKPCEVNAALLLEPSEQGIERERIFYDADSLIACGWAR